MTTSGSPSRNANLDLIRLLAAVLVLFSHSYPLSGRGPEPFAFAIGITGGDIAVAAFFIISGFLITGSYIRSAGIIDYAFKRFFRIFPALFCAVLFGLILGVFLTPLSIREYVTHPQTIHYLKNMYLDVQYSLPLVFADNIYPHAVNGSLWTLPLEVFMYGLVLLFGIIGGLKAPYIAAVLGVSLALGITFNIHPWIGAPILMTVPVSTVVKLATLFFMGSLLYLQRDRIKYSGALALVFAALIIATKGHVMQHYLYILLLPYIVLYLAQTNISFGTKLTRHGDFSYGIYVYAFPVQQLVSHWFGKELSLPLFFVTSLSITLVLAICSWKYVEAPALNYLRNNKGRSTWFR